MASFQHSVKSELVTVGHALLLLFVLGCSQVVTAEPLPVTASPVEQLAKYPQVTAPATVISRNNSRLSAEVTAVIESVPVEVGQVVTPGDPLVHLDQTDLELDLKRAEAVLQAREARHKLAQSQLQRVKALQQAVSKELLSQRQAELEESEAEMKAQRATIEQLRRDIEKTVIRAPFESIVVEQLGYVGELAGPGTPLLRVMDVGHIEVSARLQLQDTASLSESGSAYFVSHNERYPVKLHRITPALDARERSQEVRLRFTGEHPLIGTAGQIVWQRKDPHLPADLLVRRGDSLGVFVVEQDHTKFIALPHAQEGRPAGIDLPLNSQVIIDGRFLLEDGDPISIIDTTNPQN